MQVGDNPQIEVLKNFALTQQAWLGLFGRMNQLLQTMEHISRLYQPILDVIATFCVDPFEEEFTALHEKLLWDVHEFNRMLLGMPSALPHRYPTLAGVMDPERYFWDPVESAPFNLAKPFSLGNNQLSLYDRILDALLPRAAAYLQRCQRVHQGIKIIQRRFKNCHYTPGNPGALSAQKDFVAQSVAVISTK